MKRSSITALPSPSKRSSVNGIKRQTPSRIVDKFKVIAWDFDCTITKKHSCAGKQLQPDDIDNFNLPDLIADLELFKETINQLLDLGKYVAILSYGTKSTIIRTMEKVFAPDPSPFNEDNVITPMDVTGRHKLEKPWLNCYNPPSGYNKNHMLRLLQERLQKEGMDVPNDEIVLIDDTERNIDAATDEGYYGIVIPAEGCSGFNRHLTNGFLTLLGNDSNPSEETFTNAWDDFSKRYQKN